MKTPIQELIECYNVSIGLKQEATFLRGLPSVLLALREKEKQVIIEARKSGAIYGMNVLGGCDWTVDDDEITEDYYNETYNNEN